MSYNSSWLESLGVAIKDLGLWIGLVSWIGLYRWQWIGSGEWVILIGLFRPYLIMMIQPTTCIESSPRLAEILTIVGLCDSL